MLIFVRNILLTLLVLAILVLMFFGYSILSFTYDFPSGKDLQNALANIQRQYPEGIEIAPEKLVACINNFADGYETPAWAHDSFTDKPQRADLTIATCHEDWFDGTSCHIALTLPQAGNVRVDSAVGSWDGVNRLATTIKECQK